MKSAVAITLWCVLSAAMVGAMERVVAVNNNNEPVTTLSTDTLSAVQKAVLAADDSWARAYQSCDVALMDKVLHPDLMYIHGNARVDTKQVAMKLFATCANEKTTIEPLRVVIISPDTAIIEAAMTLRQKGLKDTVDSLFTRVYVRQNGDWRMIAHQTTRNPGLDATGKPK
jgi:ketosteroid isomerase-like protein